MIDPTIKIKEKKNSYTCKIKISKEEIESYLTSPEGAAELKKDFLEFLAAEFDSFVIDTVEELNGNEEAIQVSDILETVQISIEPSNEVELEEEEETEEEVTEEEN